MGIDAKSSGAKYHGRYEREFKSALVEFRFYNSFLPLKNAIFYKRIFIR